MRTRAKGPFRFRVAVLAAAVVGGVAHLVAAGGQVRTILLPRDAFPAAIDGELTHDMDSDRPMIRSAGKWIPMDVLRLTPFPDFRVDGGQAVVSAGSVVLGNGEIRVNSTPVAIVVPTALTWGSLFAIPAAVGSGFEVVTSVDQDLIAQKRYRYLGSHLGAERLARIGDRYFYAFGGNQAGIEWIHAPSGLMAEARITRAAPKALSLQIHAKLFTRHRLLTDATGQWIYAVREGHPDDPVTPMANQINTFEIASDAGVTPFHVFVAATSGTMPLIGPAANLTVMGHREDPAWFSN